MSRNSRWKYKILGFTRLPPPFLDQELAVDHMKSHNWWTGGVVSENIYWDNLKALFAPSLLVVTVILYDAVKYLGGPKQSYGTHPPKKRK